ncbi:MAG TPA: hypothetical protein VN428_05620 [Bryobacteraceae bacterium]|nr:hypothetical protein [Bryobacteraceae bacterium]
MPDQVWLSLWVRDFGADTMLRHFEELLSVFPFSKLRPGVAGLRIQAISPSEPPLLERLYGEGELEVGELITVCREFEHDDCSYIVEGWCEQFQHTEQGWVLKPSRVTLACFGPAYENDMADHFRIGAGAESSFVPDPAVAGSERAAHSNLAGLIRLSRELQTSLPVERRQLWSESGESLAERLDEALS